MHAQMTLDGQRIMMGQGSKEWRMLSARETKAATQGIFVYLADVDTHYERARVAGAEIVHPRANDMKIRNMSPLTQAAYVRAVKNFTAFHRQSPDKFVNRR
jgi:hypothetical protein